MAADLDAVYAHSDFFGATVDELFSLLEANEWLREQIATKDVSNPSPSFTTIPIVTAVNQGFNLYRIKLALPTGRTLPYRVIYAVDHSRCEIWILAVMRREEGKDGYEPESTLGKRLRDDYEYYRLVRIRG